MEASLQTICSKNHEVWFKWKKSDLNEKNLIFLFLLKKSWYISTLVKWYLQDKTVLIVTHSLQREISHDICKRRLDRYPFSSIWNIKWYLQEKTVLIATHSPQSENVRYQIISARGDCIDCYPSTSKWDIKWNLLMLNYLFTMIISISA